MKALSQSALKERAHIFLGRCQHRAHIASLTLPGQAALLAWHNLSQHALRSVASAGGLAVALLLMLVQIGFLDATQRKVTAFYDLFDFDLIMISRAYQFFYDAPPFDYVRLVQAQAHPAVAATLPLSATTGDWYNLDTERKSSTLIFGVVPNQDFFSNNAIRRGIPKIVRDDDVLVDAYSHSDFGDLSVGAEAKVNERRVIIRDQFRLGLFFYADGALMTTRQNFMRLTDGNSHAANVGLIKLVDGEKPAKIAKELTGLLPSDVSVLTRDQMLSQERNYFVSIKPLGIILRTGAWFAFIVGAVIIYQVLATDILSRMRELAVLKAMGFSLKFVYGVSVAQAVIVLLGGLVPALIAAFFLFFLTNMALHLELELNFGLVSSVMAMSIVMVGVACMLTLHRVRQADPAELY